MKLRTRKHLFLLVHLAVQREVATILRERVVDMLWPDADRSRGRHSLSQALTALRSVLGPDSIVSSDTTISLAGQLLTDLDLVDQGLRERIDSEPLAGLEVGLGIEAEHWVDEAKLRLLDDGRRVLAARLRACRRSGDLERARVLASSLHSIDPTSEDAAVSLVETYLLEQDRRSAARVLERHREGLKDLGADSSPLVTRLGRRIADRGYSQVKAFVSEPPRLLGRKASIARLESWWASVPVNQLKRALVTGTSGMGKSSLLQYFAHQVDQRGGHAVMVSFHPIGERVPYSGVAEIIRALSSIPAVSGTDAVWLSEASRVVPEIRTKYPGVPAPEPASNESTRVGISESIFQMIKSISDGDPILLALDDFGNIDSSSMEVLHLFSHRSSDTPMLILGAATREDTEESRARFWDDHHRLPPLDRESSIALARRLVGESMDSEETERVAELGQGTPHIIELLAHDLGENPGSSLISQLQQSRVPIRWDPPELLRRMLARQYEGISETERHIVHLIAAAGRRLPLDVISACLGEANQIERATLSLVERHLVRFENGLVGIRNEIHEAYLQSTIPEDAHRYYHLLILRHSQLESSTAGLERAYHTVMSGLCRDVQSELIVPASEAIRRGQSREAELVLRVAIAKLPNEDVDPLRISLCEALVEQAKFADAVRELSNISSPDAPMERRMSLVRASALVGTKKDIEATSRLVAQVVGNKSSDLVEHLKGLQLAAETAHDAQKFEELTVFGTESEKIAASTTSPLARARALMTAGYCHMMLWHKSRAIFCFSEARSLFEELGMDQELRRVLNGLGMCYTAQGSLEKAQNALAKGLELSRASENELAVANMLSNLAYVYFLQGSFDRAEALYRDAISSDAHTITQHQRANSMGSFGALLIVIGNHQLARKTLIEAQNLAHMGSTKRNQIMFRLHEADLYLATGHPERATEIETEVVDELAGIFEAEIGQGILGRHLRRFATIVGEVEVCREWDRRLYPYEREKYPAEYEVREFKMCIGWHVKDENIVTELARHTGPELPGIDARIRAVTGRA